MNQPPEAADGPTRLLERWSTLEAPFAANDYWGRADADPYVLRFGRSPLLVTAVHAARHWRRGQPKKEDAFTGGLALLAAEETGCSAAAVAWNHESDDANRDPQHPFKLALERELPQAATVLVDLHGMNDSHGYDISIGLGGRDDRSVTVGHHLRSDLEAAGYTVDFGGEATGFRGRGSGTITTWAQANGLAACQLEIATALREPGFDQRRGPFIQAFLATLAGLANGGWLAAP